jgi:glycogen debranching enzyme
MARNRAAETTELSIDVTPEVPFYIPATGPSTRPRRTLKHNDTFVVLDSHGDIGASSGGPDGLFDCDTRYLSQHRLLINGASPLLLGSNLKDDNLNLHIDLTNPDIYEGEVNILPKDTVHISRTVFVRDGTLHQRIGFVNHGEETVRIVVSLSFANDFADIFEVRGSRRTHRGSARNVLVGANELLFAYEGLDGRLRKTDVCLHPSPTTLHSTLATYVLTLAAGGRASVFVYVSARGRIAEGRTQFFTGLTAANRELKRATRDVATVSTSNDVLNEILCRSMSDLYMLVTETSEGRYPYAGIPWYSTTFGRDGIITAIETLWFDPSIARGVLRRLAAYQAERDDPLADALPGKILHEMRGGEMAALQEVPFGLYYGSVDATPLFVILAGLYAERTGDLDFLAELWPAVERALTWIDGPADMDGDGFIEYARAAQTGLANQGWKDSYDSIFHADGQLAEGPIALVEVQGYVYAAKRLAAKYARLLGRPFRGQELDRQAETLRQRFDQAFWCDEEGTYALALDGAKNPCRVRTSNPGQALFTGIVPPDRARRVAHGLLTRSFFSGWGIRTVAKGEARYNPMSYHNGSIWPHDNALIALGFARCGLAHHVAPLFEGLMDAATYMDDRRLPELFCGMRRRRARGPTLYPVACSPQAWASAAPFLLLQAMLGLEFDPEAREIRLRNSRVPALAQEITIRNLRLGDAAVDFAVQQSGEGVSIRMLRTSGNIRVTLVLDEPT